MIDTGQKFLSAPSVLTITFGSRSQHTHPDHVEIKVTDRIFQKQNVQYQTSYPVWWQVLFIDLFHKILDGMANNEDTTQAIPTEAVWSEFSLFAWNILSEKLVVNLKSKKSWSMKVLFKNRAITIILSTFCLSVKDAYDYQGRSFLHVPQDVGVNLKSEFPPEKCFIPKKLIHTWSGHTKGVAAIRWFPKSAHLLLSCSMDSKIKVSVYFKYGST